MTNIFGNMESFVNSAPQANRASLNEGVKVSESLPASTFNSEDTVQISKNNKKEKKGIIKSTKTFIANFKKFFANLGTYTKGIFRGIKNGALFGALLYTAGSAVNHFRNKAQKTVHPKLNIAIALAGAAVSVGSSMWKASLEASRKRSDIEHTYIGHEK